MDSAVHGAGSSSPNDKIFSESADEVRARNDKFRAFFLRRAKAGGLPTKGWQWNRLGKARILC